MGARRNRRRTRRGGRVAGRPDRRVLSDNPEAVRKRKLRARHDAGIEMAQIEVNIAKAISALKARDGLTEVEAESLAWPEITSAVQGVWDEFIRVWVK